MEEKKEAMQHHSSEEERYQDSLSDYLYKMLNAAYQASEEQWNENAR